MNLQKCPGNKHAVTVADSIRTPEKKDSRKSHYQQPIAGSISAACRRGDCRSCFSLKCSCTKCHGKVDA